MEVLYPPTYLNSCSISSDPPGYFHEDSFLPLLPGSQTSRHPLTVCSTETRCSPLENGLDPGRMQTPRAGKEWVAELDTEGVDNSDPSPAYSRFDIGLSRSQVAPDMLGPYPHISILSSSVL